MLNLPWRTRMEQVAELSVLISQGWVKELNSQCRTFSDACIKQQRLRARAGQQVNCSEDSPAPSRDWKRHKGREGVEQQTNLPEELPALSRDHEKHKGRDRATGQPPKAKQEVDPGADLWDRGQHSKLNCPSLLGEELTKQSCS
jgi:hypothetical protein